jgi:flotillin
MIALRLMPVLAQTAPNLASTLITIVGMMVVILVFLAIWAGRYTKVPPNQVLVVSGRKVQFVDADGKVHASGFRIVKGGGTFVIPVVERADVLSLESTSITVKVARINTADAVPIRIEAAAQVKVKDDDGSILAAVEHFLSKRPEEIRAVAAQMLEVALCASVSETAFEQVDQHRPAFASMVQNAAEPTLANMGMTIFGVIIREVSREIGAKSHA